MTMTRTLQTAAAAMTALLPFAAAAEEAAVAGSAASEEPVYENRVSVGPGYQSADSFRFGRYSGLTDQGGIGIGEFLLQRRDPWDSGGTNYYRAEGLNLGLRSRSFNLQFGNQGWYGVQLFYDGVPYNAWSDFHTIYGTSGTGALNGGALPSTTPWFGSAALAPFLNTQELKLQRDIFGGQLDYKPLQTDWQVTTAFRHDHKEGTQENSLLFGTGKNAVLQGSVPTGTSGNLLYFPMPVSYDIDRYDAKVAYNGPDLQAELGYTYSGFTDNNTSFNAVDPFSSPASIPVGTFFTKPGGNNLGPPGTLIQAAYALPPSNSAHYVRGVLGYNIPSGILRDTRLISTFQYGLQLQNSLYTADTLNTFLLAKSLGSHLGSLDGQVRTFFGNATVTSRPIDRLDLKVSYTIDKRDNDTAKQLVQSPYVDSWQTYANAIGTGAAVGVPNLILSSTIQTLKAEAGYRVLPKTKLSIGYNYKDTTRSLSPTPHQQENLAFARVNSGLPFGLNGNLGYEHSVRTGSYNPYVPWQYWGFPIAEGNPTAFYLASRTQDAIKGRLSASPLDEVSFGLESRFANNHYPASIFGLTNDHALSVSPDFSWTPIENLNLHLFYSYEQIFRDDSGQISITNPPAPAFLSPWSQKSEDNTHTVGVAADWKLTPAFKLGASYNFAYGDVMYALADQLTTAQSLILANQGNVIQPLPDMKSTLHSLTVHGTYEFTPQVSLWVGTTFERFIFNDFALAAVSNATQYGNALYPGYANPSYSVVVVGAAVHIRF